MNFLPFFNPQRENKLPTGEEERGGGNLWTILTEASNMLDFLSTYTD